LWEISITVPIAKLVNKFYPPNPENLHRGDFGAKRVKNGTYYARATYFIVFLINTELRKMLTTKFFL